MARTGDPSSFGKCSHRVEILLDDETYEALIALKAIRGRIKKPLSTYIRDVLRTEVWGHFGVLQMDGQSEETSDE